MIEVKMLVDFYDDVEVEIEVENEEGELVTVTETQEVMVKKDKVIKRMTEPYALYPRQCFKRDGSLYRDRTTVYDDLTKEVYVIKGSYNSIKKMLEGESTKVGFKKQ